MAGNHSTRTPGQRCVVAPPSGRARGPGRTVPAAELAIRRPDLVGALVRVGPTIDPAAPTSGGQIRRWAHYLLYEDPHQTPMILADFRDAGLRRVLRTLGQAVDHHIERRLPLVTVPVLLLRGRYDVIAPAD